MKKVVAFCINFNSFGKLKWMLDFTALFFFSSNHCQALFIELDEFGYGDFDTRPEFYVRSGESEAMWISHMCLTYGNK